MGHRRSSSAPTSQNTQDVSSEKSVQVLCSYEPSRFCFLSAECDRYASIVGDIYDHARRIEGAMVRTHVATAQTSMTAVSWPGTPPGPTMIVNARHGPPLPALWILSAGLHRHRSPRRRSPTSTGANDYEVGKNTSVARVVFNIETPPRPWGVWPRAQASHPIIAA